MYLSSFCYGFVFKMAEIRAGTRNTFGTLFRVTTFGESDGGGVGCVIDGCPPRIPLSEVDMQVELDRRFAFHPCRNFLLKKRKRVHFDISF